MVYARYLLAGYITNRLAQYGLDTSVCRHDANGLRTDHSRALRKTILEIIKSSTIATAIHDDALFSYLCSH